MQSEIERIQAGYRRRLADCWAIEPGSRVLEIGCGQGDMTAVLAETVGPEGHVTAVDLGGRYYGAPLTLGEATDLLKSGPLGSRIDFRFNFDLLDPSKAFEPGSFDYVVLAHSSWYYESVEQLQESLATLRGWANTLCFAEWDPAPHSFEQTAHLLAVLIQGQVEAFKSQSSANVRTPFSLRRLKVLLEAAGWTPEVETHVDSHDLQDSDWEISACLAHSLSEARALNLPEKLLQLVESQVDVLRQIAKPRGNRPLSCYSIVAHSH